MKKFAYLFTIGSTIQWSSETADTLKARLANDSIDTRVKVAEFVKRASAGHQIQTPHR